MVKKRFDTLELDGEERPKDKEEASKTSLNAQDVSRQDYLSVYASKNQKGIKLDPFRLMQLKKEMEESRLSEARLRVRVALFKVGLGILFVIATFIAFQRQMAMHGISLGFKGWVVLYLALIVAGVAYYFNRTNR